MLALMGLIGVLGVAGVTSVGEPAIDRPPLAPSVGEAKAIAAAVEVIDARAQSDYDAGEFADAAEQWERAYGLLEVEVGFGDKRQKIAHSLSLAHVRANSSDHDPRRLERARMLLWIYLAHQQRAEHAPTAAEREQLDRAGELIEIIEYRLRDARFPEVAEPEASELPPVRASSEAELRRPHGLIGGGTAGMLLGFVGIGVGAALFEADRDGPAIAAIGIGGCAVAVGAATFGIGMGELRRVRPSPMLSRSSAGIAFAGRF